jgi:hypothetical protein
MVEEIYLQAGQSEYVEALRPELCRNPALSPYHDHLDDFTSALGIAPVVRTICTLRAPEPVDPQLQEAIGRQIEKRAEKILGPRPSTRVDKASHQQNQPSASSTGRVIATRKLGSVTRNLPRVGRDNLARYRGG